MLAGSMTPEGAEKDWQHYSKAERGEIERKTDRQTDRKRETPMFEGFSGEGGIFK